MTIWLFSHLALYPPVCVTSRGPQKMSVAAQKKEKQSTFVERIVKCPHMLIQLFILEWENIIISTV